MIAQAFVLGAGLGTRLRPLTDELPKPVVPIFGKPLITFGFDHLIAAGVRSFVVNTHHLPQHFQDSLGENSYRNLPVKLVHEPLLLETGGGIKNAETLLTDETFLVYSGDILTDLPLAPLIEEHFRAGNDVTLALRTTGLATQVAFQEGRVLDIGKRHGHTGNYDYANVSIWNRSAFARFSLGEKISFIPVLVDWISDGGRVGGVVLEEGGWYNIGSPAQYLALHRTIADKQWRPAQAWPNDWPMRVASDARVDPTAQILGASSVGQGCEIGANAVISDSILWAGSQIASCCRLQRCIVRSRRQVEGTLSDAII
jgi:NDP-sugar pyrophosphorylase family protein